VDSLGRLINPSYKQRVALHEAGHMLVAYIVGILPRAYTLSSWDAFVRCERVDRVEVSVGVPVVYRAFFADHPNRAMIHTACYGLCLMQQAPQYQMISGDLTAYALF